MTRCSFCRCEVDLPFICHYCRQAFCGDHRLPEAHGCINVVSAKPPRFLVKVKVPSDASRVSVRGLVGSEVGQIVVAWLVLGFCFSAGSLFTPRFIRSFPIALFTLGLGFLAHEFAHRNVARRFGCWAEFRLWPLGLLMAVILAITSGGRFVFAAPGAVYIRPRSYIWGSCISRREYGIISVSGPLMNIAVGAFFLALTLVRGAIAEIGSVGFFVNMWLASFNLIPFGMMDGYKVFSWSPKVWAAVAIPTWVILLLGILL
ncbi:MAG: AN1-type zinc finger domain-containing protein [Candidatus Bathyarchaeia archaeon]